MGLLGTPSRLSDNVGQSPLVWLAGLRPPAPGLSRLRPGDPRDLPPPSLIRGRDVGRGGFAPACRAPPPAPRAPEEHLVS